VYLLDANVFIEAKNTYYSFATAPGFWQWLRDLHDKEIIASIPEVRDD